MERAQADGVSLVGPGGLLADLTKRVLESMFGEGAKLIALAGFGFEEGKHAQAYRHVGLLWVGWTVRGRVHRVMSAGRSGRSSRGGRLSSE